MARKRKSSKPSGSARMKEFGYRKVEVWLDATEFARMDEAARRQGKRLATWIRKVAFDQAVAQVGRGGGAIARAQLERDLGGLD